MIKSKLLSGCILILSLITAAARAASAPPSLSPVPPSAGGVRYLTFEDAVWIALHDNVDLLNLREQEESLKYQSRQALAPNEPTISYMNNDAPTFSLTQQAAQTVYQLNWTLGFPGKALANSASIRHQAEAMSEQATNQEINIMTTLSNSYINLATNGAFYKFLVEEQQRDKELMKILEKKFAASQAAKVDLLNAKVVTEQIAQNILQNRNDYEVQLTQFRQIIKQPSNKNLMPAIPDKVIIPPVEQTFEDLVPIMLRNNHSVAQAQKQVESTDASLTNSILQAFPDIQLTAAVNDWVPAGAPLGPAVLRDYTVGVGIVIPIFYPLNELQGVHAAQHNSGAAQFQLTSQQLQAYTGLQTAYTSLKAMLKDLDASERLVVPAAKASYDLTLLTYSLGKADYFMLNQSRTALHDAIRDMLTKRQNAAQFYNQLIAQMGCDIAKSEGPHACK